MAGNNTYMSFYLRSDTFRVFTGALRVLDAPKYVRFLVNPDTLKMAMIEYDQKEFTSFKVSKKILYDSRRNCLSIRSKKFCVLIADRMKWDRSKSYRVEGKIYPDQKVVVYDLSSAKAIKLRKNQNNSRNEG